MFGTDPRARRRRPSTVRVSTDCAGTAGHGIVRRRSWRSLELNHCVPDHDTTQFGATLSASHRGFSSPTSTVSPAPRAVRRTPPAGAVPAMTVTTPIAGRGVEARGLAEAGGDINGVGDVGVEQRRVEPALPRAGGVSDDVAKVRNIGDVAWRRVPPSLLPCP